MPDLRLPHRLAQTGESYGRVGVNARLLDGYAERDGGSLFEGREVEVRPMDNARDYCGVTVRPARVLRYHFLAQPQAALVNTLVTADMALAYK